MKNYLSRFIVAIIAAFFLSQPTIYTQETTSVKAEYYKNGRVAFARVNQEQKTLRTANQSQWLRDVLKLDAQVSFDEIERIKDSYGMLHIKLQQLYNGIPIEGMVYSIHYSSNGELNHISGEYTKLTPFFSNPILRVEDAYQAAIVYMQVEEFSETMIQEADKNGELVYLIKNNVLLQCFKIEVISNKPLAHSFVYVNTQNANVEKESSKMRFADVTVDVETFFNGVQTITTESIPSAFRLHDYTRGDGIFTRSLNYDDDYFAATEFIDSTGTWELSDSDKVALDVHYSMEKAYDFFFEEFGRDSYSGSGASIDCYVHYLENYKNAFFDGARFVFGDGFGVNSSSQPYTSTDIVAHEFTHGVASYTANFEYLNESGALEESFCDIFGIGVDFYANPGSANWEMGDRGNTYMLRSLKEPKKLGDPDTYQGEYWITDVFNDKGGVHSNSGVQNYWFYLLSEGGEGYNDNGDYYKVNPIGIDKALEVAYQTLTVYLGFSSQYADACFYSIQSTKDIYGQCSREVKEVTNAWHAVGLSEVYDSAVVADFDLKSIYNCGVPSVVSPVNTSLNGIDYIWKLNGTEVSTLEDPDITLPAEGSYSLQLIANGTYGCWTSDTVSLDSIYVKNSVSVPVEASCAPADTSKELKHTIDSIRINEQLFIPQSLNGYVDLSCYAQFTAMEGSEFTIAVWHSEESIYTYSYWLDKNNDGILTEDEKLPIINDSIAYGYYSDSVFIDKVSVNNSPLRLRVISSIYDDSPCAPLDFNTAHDYGLVVTPNTEAPIARVSNESYTVGKDVKVTFNHNSLHKPTSYKWYFENGIPETSTDENPIVVWDSIGVYDARLIVENAFGSDTLNLEDYVKVLPAFYLGTDVSTYLNEGILYDTGGDSANYSNNESFEFLVDSPCDSVIEFTIHYTDLAKEDYFEVYNNENAFNATESIRTESNLSNVQRVYTGDQLLIRLLSDSSITESGFALSWKAIGKSGDQLPVAGFRIDDTIPAWNQPVLFEDTSLFVSKYWDWYVNDTLMSSESFFEYRFKKSGTNNIKLKVLNCIGVDSINKTIEVDIPSAVPTVPPYLELDIEIGANLDTCIELKNTSSNTLFLETQVYENDSTVRKQFLGLNIIIAGYAHQNHNILHNHLSEKGATVRFMSPYSLNADSLATADVLFFKATNNFSSPFIQEWIANGGHMLMLSDYFSSFYYGTLLEDLGLDFSDYNDLLVTGVTYNLESSHPVLTGIHQYDIEQTYRYITYSDSTDALIRDTNNHCFMAHKQYHNGSVLMAVDNIDEDELYSKGNNQKLIDNYILSSVLKSKIAQYPDSNYKIKADSSAMACVHISTEYLYEGTYDHTLKIQVNDAQLTTLTVPIRINAFGKGEFVNHPDTLDYGVVLVGNKRKLTANIENIGTDSLIIDSIRVSNNAFTTSHNQLILPVEGKFDLGLTFTPTSGAELFDSITVYTSNSNLPKHVIYLTAEGLLPPDIELSESMVELTLKRGTTDTVSVIVSNTGDSDLLIDGSFLRRTNSIENIYHSRYLVGVNITILGAGQYSTFVDSLSKLGANINLISHTELFDTTMLRYTDILVFNYMSNFGVFDYINGIDTARFEAIKQWMYKGGSVFIDGYLPYKTEAYDYLMNGSGIENPVSSSAGLYTDVQSNFITQGVDTVYSSERWFTFDLSDTAQALLLNDVGEAVIAYSNVGEGQVLVSGCRMATDNTFIEYQNATFLINAMELLVGTPIWIKFTEKADAVIAPGASSEVRVKIDARYVAADSYETDLQFYSNDPDEVNQSFNIKLKVVEPLLDVDDTLRFLNVSLGEQLAAELNIVNDASYNVTITSFTNSCNNELVFPQGEMVIQSGQITKIVFTYIPVEEEQGECRVIAHTDDPFQPQFEIDLLYSSLDTITTSYTPLVSVNKTNVLPVSGGLFKVVVNNSQRIETVSVYNTAGKNIGVMPFLIDEAAFVELLGYGKGIYIFDVKTDKSRSVHKVAYY